MKQSDLVLNEMNQKHEERQKLFLRIHDDLLSHDYVMAYFYDSNLPKVLTTQDVFHLYIVVQPTYFEDFIKAKQQLSQEMEDVLFIEGAYNESASVNVYLKSGMKLQVTCCRPHEIKQYVWNKKVYMGHDSYGLVEYLKKETQNLVFDLNSAEVVKWRTHILSTLFNLQQSIVNEKPYQAMRLVDDLRWYIAMGWLMDHGFAPIHDVEWSKLEGNTTLLTPNQVEQLVSWDVTRNFPVIKVAVKSMVEEFKLTHRKLCHKVSLKDDISFVQEMLA